MRRRKGIGVAVLMAGMLALSGCGSGGTEQTTAAATESGTGVTTEAETTAVELKVGNTSYGISCHDPQIIVADNKYIMTGSHQVIAESSDMTEWTYVANGNRMFENIYDGDMEAFKYVGKNEDGGYSIWASNIFYNDVMKKYIMYFCTSSTYIKSSLCMAVSDTPEGPYTYETTFLSSGFGASDADQTNIYEILGEGADISPYLEYGGYNNKKWPNCIDPAVFIDAEGTQWMVYGSWSGGLFMLEIDPATGLPIHPETDEEKGIDKYFGYHLIGGKHHAVEGPYIDYNAETGYYYLFASYGNLQREGGYQIRQFRSKSPTGPYVDYAGNTLQDEADYYSYGNKMAGNYSFPSLKTAYMAPGGQSTFKGLDGEMYITYHQRFDNGSEYHEPRVHRLLMNADGWYVMAPFETGSQPLTEGTYSRADIGGTYYVVDHGMEVGSKIREAVECSFTDGTISGKKISGTYTVADGTGNITLTIDDATFTGVIFDMTDEAGNPVRCISAAGPNNHSIWAVQYK